MSVRHQKANQVKRQIGVLIGATLLVVGLSQETSIAQEQGFSLKGLLSSPVATKSFQLNDTNGRPNLEESEASYYQGQKWEYKTLPIDGFSKSWQSDLSRAGGHGWEMVAIYQGMVIFKRPKVE